jgi:hypothetical protein
VEWGNVTPFVLKDSFQFRPGPPYEVTSKKYAANFKEVKTLGVSEAKYHYHYWRPVTAIQLADTDGNPDTIVDPGWEPLETTSAVPDYDSGHRIEGGAAAQVLRRFFKTDQVGLSTCRFTLLLIEERSGGANEGFRSYSLLPQAADENGVSRIYVGFHFRKAVDEGIKHGRKIGDRAIDRFLKPVH